MPTARELRRVRRSRSRLPAHRARRLAGLVVCAGTVLVVLLVTAFGANPSATSAPPVATTVGERVLATGPPEPEIVAVYGRLRLQLPVSQEALTAVGYHEAPPGALALEPVGSQANRGLLGRLADRLLGRHGGDRTWYRLDGDVTSALDVGATAETDVFSPVDGTVVGISRYVVDGRPHGVTVDVQPSLAPSLIVSISRVRPDPNLTVGAHVVAASSRLGSVVDLSRVETQALARYTQDGGNHVSIAVRAAPTVTLG